MLYYEWAKRMKFLLAVIYGSLKSFEKIDRNCMTILGLTESSWRFQKYIFCVIFYIRLRHDGWMRGIKYIPVHCSLIPYVLDTVKSKRTPINYSQLPRMTVLFLMLIWIVYAHNKYPRTCNCYSPEILVVVHSKIRMQVGIHRS